MQSFALQALLSTQSLTMVATAYAATKTESEEQPVESKKVKGEGLKGLIKKLNPVRLFSKIFKHKKDFEDEVEKEI